MKNKYKLNDRKKILISSLLPKLTTIVIGLSIIKLYGFELFGQNIIALTTGLILIQIISDAISGYYATNKNLDDMVNMAQYFQSDIASVHSPNDATSLFYKKLNAITNSRLIKARLFLAQCLLSRFEKFAYPKFDNVHVLANDGAEYLRSICPGINITVIPFGV